VATFEAEIRGIARERPTIPLRASPVRLQHDGPFRAVQEVTAIQTRVQERLDAIADKLVGNVPRLPELVPPHDSVGLLGLTETICRNAVIRAQHMDRVLDLIEEQLS
jgi:hypothetical protein